MMVKHLQTVAAMACMKSSLMTFNFIFWLSGLVILAIGIWMKVAVELDKYAELSTKFANTAPYVLIGIGSLIIVMASLACCCTVKGQPVLLYVYGGFLVIVFVLQLGAGVSIFAYRSKLAAGFDYGFNQAMINYRNESTHTADDLDMIQRTLQCCGSHSPTDWENLTPPMPIPLSCCIKDDCDTADEKQIYSQGCYEVGVDFLKANIAVMAAAAIFTAFFPLLGAVMSCCLASTANRAKYEQMA